MIVLAGFVLLFATPIYLFMYWKLEREVKINHPLIWQSFERRDGFLSYPSGLGFHLAILMPSRLPVNLRRENWSSIVWIRFLGVLVNVAFIYIACMAFLMRPLSSS